VNFARTNCVIFCNAKLEKKSSLPIITFWRDSYLVHHDNLNQMFGVGIKNGTQITSSDLSSVTPWRMFVQSEPFLNHFKDG